MWTLNGVWPSLSALNSSGYTAQGPGSRAWYMDAGVRREAEYVAGSGWLPVASLAALGSPANPFPTTWSAVHRAALAAVSPPGTIVWAANPCVPLGMSRLIRNAAATNFVPPTWELIAGEFCVGITPLAVLASGLNTVQTVYSSQKIPLYMLPLGGSFEMQQEYDIQNASGVAGALLAIGIGSPVPVSLGANDFIIKSSLITPNGVGISIQNPNTFRSYVSINESGVFVNQTPVNQGAGGSRNYNNRTVDPDGAYITFQAQPSGVGDIVRLWQYALVMRGCA